MKQTMVVGLGSAYGDDQLGWAVIEQLEREMKPLAGVLLLKSERGGLDLLERLESLSSGQTWLVVVDALVDAVVDTEKTATPVGTLFGPVTLEPADLSKPLSSHAIGVDQLLAMLSTLGGGVQQVELFGIRVDDSTMRDEAYQAPLSKAVAVAVPRLVSRIRELIQSR